MITLTVGYAVVLTLIAITTRQQEGWQRNLTAVVLAAFAVSALHLSHDASQPDSPLTALLGHHASLPLVLVILYQDYRFAFADLFLRRALSLVAVVCLAVALHVWVAVPIATALGGEQGESLAATAVHVALWVATALLYPVIRRGVGQFVDSVLLGRVDYRHVRDDVALAVSRAETPNEILRKACAVLRPALGIRELEPRPSDEVADAKAPLVTRADGAREAIDHALVHVPTNNAPHYVIDIRGLNDGRRLMSDDVALLESVASLVARRIDAVRVTQERFDRGLREREIMQLAAEAELRSLRAQLNPHFLFNALTTIGYLLKAAPDKALGTLYQLTDLLRAVLRRPPGELVSLGEELVGGGVLPRHRAGTLRGAAHRVHRRAGEPPAHSDSPVAGAAAGGERGQARDLASAARRDHLDLRRARERRRRPSRRAETSHHGRRYRRWDGRVAGTGRGCRRGGGPPEHRAATGAALRRTGRPRAHERPGSGDTRGAEAAGCRVCCGLRGPASARPCRRAVIRSPFARSGTPT